MRDKQTISFQANKKIKTGSEDYLCIKVNESVSLLKLCVLYGYNASGKSNFLRSIIVSGPKTKNEEIDVTPSILLRDWSLQRLEGDVKRKQFFVNFLENTDVQITDLEVKSTTISLDEEMLKDLVASGIPKSFLENLTKEKQIESKELYFMHETEQGKFPIQAMNE